MPVFSPKPAIRIIELEFVEFESAMHPNESLMSWLGAAERHGPAMLERAGHGRSRWPEQSGGMSNMRATKIAAVAALGLVTTAGAVLADAGPFTKDQAEKGHLMFNNHCAECHRPNLQGGLGPSLVNDAFKQKWEGKPVADLRTWIHENMPQNAPKSLPDDQLDPIVAWIMSKNDVQPGDKPLSKDSATAQFPSTKK